MADAIRVMIVDDHPIVREGLRTLFSDESGIDVVAEAADGEEAIVLALDHKPDVILMDVVLPKMDGVAAAAEIRSKDETIQIVLLTSSLDENLRLREAIDAGALGFLRKDIPKEDILRAIKNAHAGVPTLHPEAQKLLLKESRAPRPPHLDLTPRELDVLKSIAHGQSNKIIAANLQLSEGTVKGYVSTVLSKLGVDDRTQAAIYAIRHNIVEDS